MWRSRARLPDVLSSFLRFLHNCSCVGRKLSSRVRALIRELNETVFALNFLETGGIGRSESCEKVEFSILCTNLVSPTFRRLQSGISDFRPPSWTESGEVALRKLLRRLCVDF